MAPLATKVPDPCSSSYACDFTCQHVDWGYMTASSVGEFGQLATVDNLTLLYDLRADASFFSRRWSVGTNPDFAFCECRPWNVVFRTDVFHKSSRRLNIKLHSQHPSQLVMPVHSNSMKCWSCRKI